MTRTQRRRKILRRALRAFLITLTLGIVLVAIWTATRPQGQFQPAASPGTHADSTQITVLTWNVLNSKYRDWPARRLALNAALQARPSDILCFQEASAEQVAFLQGALPEHNATGIARPDNDVSASHCPIFYRLNRFAETDSGTFWLDGSKSGERQRWTQFFPRYCNWVELEERETGQRLRVYNTHLPIHPTENRRAAEMLAQEAARSEVPVIICGDFNHGPRSEARKLLLADTLHSAEQRGVTTQHVRGWGLFSLDAVLIDQNWTVRSGEIIRFKKDDVHPSDHFGLHVNLAAEQ